MSCLTEGHAPPFHQEQPHENSNRYMPIDIKTTDFYLSWTSEVHFNNGVVP